MIQMSSALMILLIAVLEAYANVPESVNGINPATGRTSGVSVTALDNSGKEWNFYIRDNKLITMYPSV